MPLLAPPVMGDSRGQAGVGAPGAASEAVRELLTGPVVPGRVLAVFPTAVYVEAGGRCLAVVSADALRLPCAVVIGARSADAPFSGWRAGAPALVGAGAVRVQGASVRVARWWAPRRPLPLVASAGAAVRVGAVEGLLPPLAGAAAEPLERLLALANRPRPAVEIVRAGRALVGLGPGLTPDGDDLLAATLLTLSAAPMGTPARRLGHRLADAVTGPGAPATTTLSATLLAHAAAGDGLPEAVDLVDALAGRGRAHDLAGVVARLVAVGHSSGAALAHGAVAGARLVLGLDPAVSPDDVPVADVPAADVVLVPPAPEARR